MIRIIDGKKYDTDTSELLCDLPCKASGVRDFSYHETSLYRTKKGSFFIAGHGGPMSMWSEPCGSNSWTSGSGLRAVDADRAREILEDADKIDLLEKYFEVEEG